MNNDRSRLPKWAQRELERLERDLGAAHARLAAGPDDSDTFAFARPDWNLTTQPLGRGVPVFFMLADGRSVQVRNDGDVVDVLVSGMASAADGLQVMPRSSNHVVLR